MYEKEIIKLHPTHNNGIVKTRQGNVFIFKEHNFYNAAQTTVFFLHLHNSRESE